MNTGEATVRERCSIPKDLARWIGEVGAKKLIGERRWYAGYFTAAGGYFFDETYEEGCESKLTP